MPLLRSASHISKTPVELLAEIFREACSDPQGKECTLLTITWVSRHWRAVALNCPSLWSTIHLPHVLNGDAANMPSYYTWQRDLSLEFARVCLSRSKVVPVSLSIEPFGFGEIRTARLFEFILQHRSSRSTDVIRIKELTILPDAHQPKFLRFRGVLVDQITIDLASQLRLSPYYEGHPRLSHLFQRVMASSACSPTFECLQSIVLWNCTFDWRSIFLNLPPTTTHIAISRPTNLISLSHFLQILTDKSSRMKASALRQLELNNTFLVDPEGPMIKVPVPGQRWANERCSELPITKVQFPELLALKLIDICPLTLLKLLDQVIVGVNTNITLYPAILPDVFTSRPSAVTVVVKDLYDYALKTAYCSTTGERPGRVIERIELRSGWWGLSMVFKTSVPGMGSNANVIRIHLGEKTDFILAECIETLRHQDLTRLTSISLDLADRLHISPFILLSTVFGHPSRVPNLKEVEVSGWGGLTFLGCLDWCCRSFAFHIGKYGLDDTGLRDGPRIEAFQAGRGRCRYPLMKENPEMRVECFPEARSCKPLSPGSNDIHTVHPPISPDEEKIIGSTCFPSLKVVRIRSIPPNAEGCLYPSPACPDESEAKLDEFEQNVFAGYKIEEWFCNEFVPPRVNVRGKRKLSRQALNDVSQVGQQEFFMHWEGTDNQERDGVKVVMTENAMLDHVHGIRYWKSVEWWSVAWGIPARC